MNKLLVILGLSFVLTGCGDGLTDREETCLDNGGTWEQCTYEGRKHAKEMAMIENRGSTGYNYPPVEQGVSYTNYYGNPQYGYWDSQGMYRFNDPSSQQAIATNSFLIGAGLGGLAGYLGTKAAMKSSWSRDNPSGWKSNSYTAKKYYDKRGNVISKQEYIKRKNQSNKDRQKFLANKNKKKAVPNSKIIKSNIKPKTTGNSFKKPLTVTRPPVKKKPVFKQKSYSTPKRKRR